MPQNEPLPLIVESARDGGLKRQQSPPRMPDITASQMEKEDASHTVSILFCSCYIISFTAQCIPSINK